MLGNLNVSLLVVAILLGIDILVLMLNSLAIGVLIVKARDLVMDFKLTASEEILSVKVALLVKESP